MKINTLPALETQWQCFTPYKIKKAQAEIAETAALYLRKNVPQVSMPTYSNIRIHIILFYSLLGEAYQIDTLDWTFIRALYFISRRMKTEYKFYEKNFKNTAERVIPRLINLLQWIDDQESSNQNNFIYIKLLKESGIHGLILISGPTCFLTLGGSITVVSRSSNFIYFW